MVTLGHKRPLSVKCEDMNERLLNTLAETSAFRRPLANTSAHNIFSGLALKPFTGE